jgi:hypothetical protein
MIDSIKMICGLVTLVILSGCRGLFTPTEIKQCEKYIVGKLDNPDSYNRIEYASLALPYPTPKYWEVGIDYSFREKSGVIQRGSQLCDFPLRNGRADTSKYIDFDRRLFKK